MAQSVTHNETTFAVGDTVAVHQKIKEGDKTRTQIFEGVVIAIKNRQNGKSFTVRKIGANGIGVEKIFPLHTPLIDKIERRQVGKVRRAKLYYLRDRVGKAAMNIRKRAPESKKSKI